MSLLKTGWTGEALSALWGVLQIVDATEVSMPYPFIGWKESGIKYSFPQKYRSMKHCH